ncbi:hypothetical protein [Natronolimnohabitans innermongolicus]|uniref:Uncharacterized protein n=1 Tax=Natronolimnohabitans innermongolicus JCM 12255 TaxID=1227499 RepID=L9WTM2_9EURY|nr:hypothetical protein [Natronolimnohabitans innermongolicus]ELY52551.1 hypothetical protein C493_15920 [Natronolimnohabitans innermongolicus JCM 12255]
MALRNRGNRSESPDSGKENIVENFHCPALELGGDNAHIVTDDAAPNSR